MLRGPIHSPSSDPRPPFISPSQIIRPNASFQAIQRNLSPELPSHCVLRTPGRVSEVDGTCIPIDMFHFFPFYQHMALWATVVPAAFFQPGNLRLDRGSKVHGGNRGNSLTSHCGRHSNSQHERSIVTAQTTPHAQFDHQTEAKRTRYTPTPFPIYTTKGTKKYSSPFTDSQSNHVHRKGSLWYSNLGNCPKE